MVLDRIFTFEWTNGFLDLSGTEPLKCLSLNPNSFWSQIGQNLRGSSEQEITGQDRNGVIPTLKMCPTNADAYTAYTQMLEAGIAREVARMVLPVTIFSSAYVTMNARSLMNFLSLPGEQSQIRSN